MEKILKEYPLIEDNIDEFYSDEEPEEIDSKQKDMKTYIDNLHTQMSTVVNALKKAEV